jgi:uncharacterized protein (TIGR03083 family)
MEYAEHIEAVERETGAFARALMKGDADAQVPTCPEWKLIDLAKHVGNVMGFWSHVLCDGTGRPKPEFPEEVGPAPTMWFTTIASALVGELKATPPDTEVWTWSPNDKSARFAGRRMAHEVAIHRYDAQSAVGAPTGVEPALAADGIEEIFNMIDSWTESGRGEGQTLHLHGTDDGVEGNEWLIAMNPDGLDVKREHAKGDLALRGAVSDLELVLYDRPPLGPVEKFGDESVLDAWYRVFKFG